MVIALENALNDRCLTVWHFKWDIETYKIYLVVYFGLALTTFFYIQIWEKGKRGRGLAGKRVAGKVETNRSKVKKFVRGYLGLALGTSFYTQRPSQIM